MDVSRFSIADRPVNLPQTTRIGVAPGRMRATGQLIGPSSSARMRSERRPSTLRRSRLSGRLCVATAQAARAFRATRRGRRSRTGAWGRHDVDRRRHAEPVRNESRKQRPHRASVGHNLTDCQGLDPETADQGHRSGRPCVPHPADLTVGRDQPALLPLLDEVTGVAWGRPLLRPRTVSRYVFRGAGPIGATLP